MHSIDKFRYVDILNIQFLINKYSFKMYNAMHRPNMFILHIIMCTVDNDDKEELQTAIKIASKAAQLI